MKRNINITVIGLLFFLSSNYLFSTQNMNVEQYYKVAINEYNKGDYESALQNIQKTMSIRRNKKDRELLGKIRDKAKSFMEAGTALIHFNSELAEENLILAKKLTDPSDKKSLELIEKALKDLKQSE